MMIIKSFIYIMNKYITFIIVLIIYFTFHTISGTIRAEYLIDNSKKFLHTKSLIDQAFCKIT